MKLIVGLGNPGREYVGTRHNIGFDVLDSLAQKLGWVGGPGEFDRLARGKFDGLTLDGTLHLASGPKGGGDEKLLLLKPATYMNLSGQAVQAAMAFYNLTPSNIMIVLDDVALPCGRLRMRKDGSSGGHNGLKDIERALGTDQYPRMRIGIDAPPQFVPGKDYVLQPFSSEQRKALEPAIDRSAMALMTWLEKGVVAAMNAFNASEEKE
jgi:peptidyl-tRNA hydrolase, PTH1 family